MRHAERHFVVAWVVLEKAWDVVGPCKMMLAMLKVMWKYSNKYNTNSVCGYSYISLCNHKIIVTFLSAGYHSTNYAHAQDVNSVAMIFIASSWQRLGAGKQRNHFKKNSCRPQHFVTGRNLYIYIHMYCKYTKKWQRVAIKYRLKVHSYLGIHGF